MIASSDVAWACNSLMPTNERQRRDEQDPAADPEEPRHIAGEDPQRHHQHVGAHQVTTSRHRDNDHEDGEPELQPHRGDPLFDGDPDR